jgi:hypothetical protein
MNSRLIGGMSYGVRRSKSEFDGVIGSEIPIHDPLAFADESLLELHPLISRRLLRPGCQKTLSNSKVDARDCPQRRS